MHAHRQKHTYIHKHPQTAWEEVTKQQKRKDETDLNPFKPTLHKHAHTHTNTHTYIHPSLQYKPRSIAQPDTEQNESKTETEKDEILKIGPHV